MLGRFVSKVVAVTLGLGLCIIIDVTLARGHHVKEILRGVAPEVRMVLRLSQRTGRNILQRFTDD